MVFGISSNIAAARAVSSFNVWLQNGITSARFLVKERLESPAEESPFEIAGGFQIDLVGIARIL
jgi:hypothetical protein